MNAFSPPPPFICSSQLLKLLFSGVTPRWAVVSRHSARKLISAPFSSPGGELPPTHFSLQLSPCWIMPTRVPEGDPEAGEEKGTPSPRATVRLAVSHQQKQPLNPVCKLLGLAPSTPLPNLNTLQKSEPHAPALSWASQPRGLSSILGI